MGLCIQVWQQIESHQLQGLYQPVDIMGIRKGVAFSRLGRSTSHKLAMLKNMVTSLIKHERIVTTLPKAKELRHFAERVITFTKNKNTLTGMRLAERVVKEKPVLTKLFEVLGPRYEKREGGYTRILKLAQNRKGDNAPMAVMEYIDRPGELRAARPPAAIQKEYLNRKAVPLTDEEIAAMVDDMKEQRK